MKDLKSIVRSLSKKETKFLIDYYKNNDEKNRLVLFKGVLNKKLDTDEDAAVKLYGKKCSAYSHLKGRLKEDLMNLLLFFMHEVEHSSAVMQAEIDVDRMLMQAKLLHRRKATDLAIKLLKKCYDLCDEFELIKEKVIVTYWYSIIAGNKEGIDRFNEINININNDLNLLQNYMQAFNIRQFLTLIFRKKLPLNIYSLAQNRYDKIKIINNKVDSKNIEFYYYLTAIAFHSLQQNWAQVKNYATKLNILTINNIQVKSVVRVVNSFLQLFKANIYLTEFNAATRNALDAYKVINKSKLANSVNELIVIENIFLSNFRTENTKYLQLNLEKGLTHKQINSSKVIFEKWLFFKSAYYFKIKDYKKCLNILYQTNELTQKKTGWHFSFKLLEILCYIEQEEFDMVNYRIENFRKLLSKKENANFERIKTIHQILKSLLKFGFDFKKVLIKENENLNLLKEGKDEFYWNPLGFEIIRFDEWFFEHV